MRLKLLVVGRTDVDWVREGLEMYSSRLRRYVPFEVLEIPLPKDSASWPRERIKDREGELILKKLSDGDRLILLDERGKEFRSVDFARELEKRMSGIGKDIVFAIGGAWGFSEAVYSRSDGMLSLSRMTFPHQLVRVVFAEQLYRAFTIIKGEPYHHE